MRNNARGYKGQAQKNVLDRGLQAFAQTQFGGVLFLTVFPVIDRKLLPLTRGRLGMSGSFPSLILHARGAKSGEPRETPLLYAPRGADLIVIASKVGSPTNPAWYYNVTAHPDVEIDIRGTRRKVHAREVHGEERDACWAIAADMYNGYEAYQGRTGGRVIPVFVLEPVGS